MPLSRRERFFLKSQMVDVLNNDRDWDFRRINLLLIEYGCAPLGGYGNDDFTFEDSIKDVSDADLLDIYSIVVGVEPAEVRSQIESVDSLWKTGYVRVFLSHSAVHKQFIGQVADELAVSGIHAFVAHEAMEYEQPWQEQIEHGLRTMQAFVAIVHSEFLTSAWCQQEVGWALGRGVPRYVIRHPVDPQGFISRTQWPQGGQMNPRDVAALILEWVSKIPEFSDQIVEGLLEALRAAQNYIDAGATARRIATIDTLTPSQWAGLAGIYHGNDQVGRSGLVARAFAPYYREHGQTWPPAQPDS